MHHSGFQSTNRANPLAQKILASDIALGLNSNVAFYAGDNWAFVNNTQRSSSDNYMSPPSSRVINGQTFVESQRFLVSRCGVAWCTTAVLTRSAGCVSV